MTRSEVKRQLFEYEKLGWRAWGLPIVYNIDGKDMVFQFIERE